MTQGSTGRHPELLDVLARHRPAATHREVWGAGTLPLEFSAYLTTARVPDELVTSVRCIVTAPGGIVVCENRREQHVLPGGRLESGETMTEAVVREIAEETAWQLDPQTLTYLGFVHLAHLGPRPDGYAYPYPDGVQLIFGGTARSRSVGVDAAWTDTEGWELASRVVPPAELDESVLSPIQIPFLRRHLDGQRRP
ncbi:NUDIX domain-containing protein [Actinopolymorpha sp. B9G3]|uniref:NUDIX hydrolase n=1 Tax=Actinopolymorpha sp. B9G3 TaxID=3158970 RepID=UPI0032D90D79